MTSARALAAALAVTVMLVAGCGDASETATGSSSGAPVMTGLEGEFATIDGAQLDLGDLEGTDVVLWFWAPW